MNSAVSLFRLLGDETRYTPIYFLIVEIASKFDVTVDELLMSEIILG